MGKDDPQLLSAVLELTKNVSEIKTTLVTEVGAIRRDLSAVHEEFREEIKIINATIAEEKKITGVVRPLVLIWERKKSIIVGASTILILTGASLGGLVVDRVNKITGVSDLRENVKKNSEILKRLCDYLDIKGIE